MAFVSSSGGLTSPTVSQNYFITAISTCSAVLCTHPLDVVKVRLQVQAVHRSANNALYRGMFQGLAHVARTEGAFTLWAGTSPALLRACVYGPIRLGLYEPFKLCMGHQEERTASISALWQKVAAAALSGSLAAFLTNPLEFLKVRQQAQSAERITLMSVVKITGVRSLWNGASVAMARTALLTVGQMAGYDHCKHVFVSLFGVNDTAKTAQLAAAFAAGLITTTLTSPLDVLKTRLMHSKDGQRSILNVTMNMLKTEGPTVFLKGWVPNYIRQAPQTFIIMLVQEELRSLFGFHTL